MNILIFGGTTESRLLIDKLSKLNLNITVSVATEYGADILENISNSVKIIQGRLSLDQMKQFIQTNSIDMVVDATHPYAVEVGSNIKQVCCETNTKRFRIGRDENKLNNNCIYVNDFQQLIKALNGLSGNIMLTTGSKDLQVFSDVNNYSDRIFPRVLPTVDAINKCIDLGYKNSHIIAIQGPFTFEMNKALINQYNIKVLVTKDSGKIGGFYEKIMACTSCEINALVIGRPPEREGVCVEQVFSEIKSRL